MIKIAILLCAILFATEATFAALVPPVVINKDQTNYDLVNHMEMYIDKTHRLTLEDVTKPSFSQNFVVYNFAQQRTPENYGQSVWLRFQVVNPLPDDVHIFLTKNFATQYTEWILYKKTPKGFVKMAFLPKTLHVSLFPLDIPEYSTQTYYLHNYSEGWLQTTFELITPAVHFLRQIDNFFIMGIQYGIALALLFHSIFIYLFLRDKSYLVYIVFVASCIVAYLYMDGLLNRLPTITISNWGYLHPFRFVMVVVGFMYLLFAKTILRTEEYTPRLNLLIDAHLISAIPCGILGWMPSFGYYQLAVVEIFAVTYYINFAFVLAFISGFLVSLKGYKPAQYYLAGLLAMMTGSLFHLAAYYRFITLNVFLFRLPQLGLNVDMILQAIALAVRFHLIQEAQIKTQRQIVKLQERSLKEKQRLITAYARFFPRRFLELLKKKSILDIHLGDQTEKDMTVLFADLRNFTTLLENKTPSESFSFVNGYLSQIGPLIREHEGVVDKYIGDAILAIYEGPSQGAVYTAIDIFKILNQAAKGGAEKVDMGVGIHFGKLMVGTIGEKERMDGTVISDTVNTASRLENLNKIYGTHIIISGQVLDALVDKNEFKIRFLDHVIVKGRTQGIKLYEVFDNDPPELIEKKLKIQDDFHTAIQYFQERKFKEAIKIFESCHQLIPTDKVILLYMERCKALIKKEYIRDWRPIAKLTDKTELIYETAD